LIVWFSSVPSKLTFSSARALIQDSVPYSARKLVCWFFLSCACRAHLPPPEIFLHRQYSARASILGLVLWPLLVLLLQPIFYSDRRRALFACSFLLGGCLCARALRARQLASPILFCRSLQALKNQFLPGGALLAPLALGPSPGFNSIPTRAVERPAQFRRCLFWLLLSSCRDLIDRFVSWYDF
jgi:hypothetical protein